MSRSYVTTFGAMIALGCALSGCAGNSQASGPAAPTSAPAAPMAANDASAGKSVCIMNHEIDHTTIVDDRTILFYMKGRKIIWKNTLPFDCPELKIQDGFAYETSIDQICSNLLTIHVIEHGGGPRFGAVCQLGEFTPYTPPPKPSSG